MSESQFKEQADTGDILLFRGSAAVTKITRAVSRSYFDHVAMVLKFETDPDEVYLVESTGNLGVSLNKWSFLREHVGEGKFYKKMILRHIDFDRGDSMVDSLEKFLSEAVGKKYGLGGLLKQKTIKHTKDSDFGKSEMISEDRSFFCSELVAKAFKCLKIIEDDETSCTQFYPGTFSSKGDSFLKLTPRTSIGSELQIIMDKDEQDALKYLDDDMSEYQETDV